MKVQKVAKRKPSDDDNYIVELKDGRSVQLAIVPFCSPYFCQPVSNEEREYALSLVNEFIAANK
jgi:hypothetical protein